MWLISVLSRASQGPRRIYIWRYVHFLRPQKDKIPGMILASAFQQLWNTFYAEFFFCCSPVPHIVHIQLLIFSDPSPSLSPAVLFLNLDVWRIPVAYSLLEAAAWRGFTEVLSCSQRSPSTSCRTWHSPGQGLLILLAMCIRLGGLASRAWSPQARRRMQVRLGMSWRPVVVWSYGVGPWERVDWLNIMYKRWFDTSRLERKVYLFSVTFWMSNKPWALRHKQ